MDAIQILQSDPLDLLFENRNKDYGAYDLRRKYNRRIGSALMITGLMAVGIFAASFFVNAFSSKGAGPGDAGDVVLRTIEEHKPPPIQQPPPPKVEQPPQVQTTKLTTMVIKKDEEVKKEELPPVDEIERVDVVSKEGVADDGRINLPPVDNGTGVVEIKKEQDENIPFEKVEIEASVNINVWRRWLENQLQRYVEDAASAGMSAGQYTVQVRFLVERDGSITDVKALNDPGYGLAKGAEEVVRKGPKWTPGEQNGKKVRSYRTQPISFMIEN